MLLKRHSLPKPARAGNGWTKLYRAWLRGLAHRSGALGYGASVALGSLLRQMAALEEEIAWQVLIKLAKAFHWKILDPMTGRELTL